MSSAKLPFESFEFDTVIYPQKNNINYDSYTNSTKIFNKKGLRIDTKPLNFT